VFEGESSVTIPAGFVGSARVGADAVARGPVSLLPLTLDVKGSLGRSRRGFVVKGKPLQLPFVARRIGFREMKATRSEIH